MLLDIFSVALATILPVFHLVFCTNLPSCKPPFQRNAGFCLYIRKDISLVWEDAYNHCSNINGKLVTCYNILISLKSVSGLVGSRPTWTGINDIRSERYNSRDGWQLGKGSRVLPLNNSGLWVDGQPENYGNQDCVAIQSSTPTLNDQTCSLAIGLMCEPASGSWKRKYLLTMTVWNSSIEVTSLDQVSCAFRAGAVLNCARFAHSPTSWVGGGRCIVDGCYGLAGVAMQLMPQEGWAVFEFVRGED